MNQKNGKQKEKKICIAHVNVRLSISFLLLKLVATDIIAVAIFVFFYFSLSAANALGSINSTNYFLAVFLVLSFAKLLITIYVVLEWLNEYYEITQHAVFYKKGLIFKKVERYNMQNIKKIEIFQGVFGKLLNYGELQLFDWRLQKYAGIYQIHNPMKYLHILEELLPNTDEQTALLREHIIERESN